MDSELQQWNDLARGLKKRRPNHFNEPVLREDFTGTRYQIALTLKGRYRKARIDELRKEHGFFHAFKVSAKKAADALLLEPDVKYVRIYSLTRRRLDWLESEEMSEIRPGLEMLYSQYGS